MSRLGQMSGSKKLLLSKNLLPHIVIFLLRRARVLLGSHAVAKKGQQQEVKKCQTGDIVAEKGQLKKATKNPPHQLRRSGF